MRTKILLMLRNYAPQILAWWRARQRRKHGL